ncbi:MAG: hypothetical protein LC708_02005, partial [Actinobacteria bacterium]|nr:hypothetical protein [Actinomycetota bacterium]
MGGRAGYQGEFEAVVSTRRKRGSRHGGPHTTRGPGRSLAGLVSLLLAISLLVAEPAAAFVVGNVSPQMPDTVVGQTATPGALLLQNSSTAGEVLEFRDISMVPACNVPVRDCLGGIPEPGVYDLSATGVGQGFPGPIPGCEGTWTIVPDNPDPRLATTYTFVPPAPLVLDPGESCVVNFTFDTLRVPTNDALPATPGVQTHHTPGVTPVQCIPGTQPPPCTGTIQSRQGLSTFSTVTPVQPGLTTDVAPFTPAVPPFTTNLGTTIDTAHLTAPPASTPFVIPPVGTITFNLYGPFPAGVTPVCTGPPAMMPGSTQTVVVSGFGDYTTPAPVPIPGAGTYTWTATFTPSPGPPNPSYLPIGPVGCNDPRETFTVAQVTPTITTLADPTGTALPGALLSDTATLSGGFFPPGTPPGTITFDLYFSPEVQPGPTPPPICTGIPFDTRTVTNVTANGTYSTPTPVVANGPGIYTWVARFTPGVGDTNNLASASLCNDPAETVVVTRANPSIVTAVSQANAPLGTPVTDTATISGLAPVGTPNGTITFSAFGPFPLGSPPTCTGTPIPLGSRTVTSNGTYTSDPFTPPGVGEYFFIATFSGDPNNNPFTTPCGAANEQVTVPPNQPAIVTVVSAAAPPNAPVTTAPLGTPVIDRATITNLAPVVPNPPTQPGTVTFTVFPNTTCTPGTGVVLGDVAVTGNGTYDSPPFTPPNAGEYRFVARYNGDVNNFPVTTACGDPGESLTVNPNQPDIVTTATPTATVGGTISDTAVISNLFIPPGTPPGTSAGDITFTLFNNITCTGAPVVPPSVVPVVNGNGSYTSPPVTIDTPGTYYWIASYGGNANNLPAATDCAEVGEISIVEQARPEIVTVATGPVTLTRPISDTATISGLVNPVLPPAAGVGTITFTLFGPGNPTCTGPPIFTSTVPATTGNGSYTSGSFTPTASGTYEWIASYSGDVNNEAVATACGDPNEQSVVTVLPTIMVEKSAAPPSLPEPGGDFTFTVVVTNTSTEPLTINSLSDDIYGDLATRPGSTCGALIGTTLPVGASSPPCTFVGPFTGPAGAEQTDVVTVVGTGNQSGVEVRDTDDATVTITPGPPPSIAVDKTADPLSLPEPGGDFTFTVVVSNPDLIQAITITSLEDDIYGDLATRPGSTCGSLIGTTLAPGAVSAPCTFVGPFTGPPGAEQTDTVTVTGVDDRGQTATDTDDATVAITNVVPDIIVEKDAAPSSLPEPGGEFTFSVRVLNNGPEPVTITSLIDDIYGNIATRPGSTCGSLIGLRLDPGEVSPTCTFTGNFTGTGGQAQTDTVTATAVDDSGDTVSDTDDATVTLTPLAPTLRVEKTADPLTKPEPGGNFTFLVVVTNTTPRPLTLTALVDDVYGDLNGKGTCAVGATLEPNGGTYSCSFVGAFTGQAGDAQTDTVTATAVDNQGNQVSAQDTATVTLTPVPPSIAVEKTANPLSLPEPGGDFTFTVVVSNPNTVEPITITSLTDDIYGDLATRPGSTCGALIGTTLAPGATSAPCTFTGPFSGSAGASQTDVVTVTGVDDDGQTATDTDDATVTLTPLAPPTLTVEKTADPLTRPEPGGDFTFTVVV